MVQIDMRPTLRMHLEKAMDGLGINTTAENRIAILEIMKNNAEGFSTFWIRAIHDELLALKLEHRKE